MYYNMSTKSLRDIFIKALLTISVAMIPFSAYAEPKKQGDTKMTERITQTAGRTQLGEF